MKKSKITTLGFGVPASSDPHHYIVNVTAGKDSIEVIEHLGMQAKEKGDASEDILRAIIPRSVWVAIRDPLKREFNSRLKKLDMRESNWKKGRNEVDRLLGKELCVLAWATETATKQEASAAIRNWLALQPEERWWLFGMAIASGGESADKPKGWRVALYHALCDGAIKVPTKRPKVTPMDPIQQAFNI